MKRLFATLLSLLLVLSLLAGCQSAPAQNTPAPNTPAPAQQAKPDALFTPGSYEGSANGFGGELVVSVTVDSASILSVEITSHNETAGVADAAIATLPGQIVEYQTIAIDTVSGCTLASKAILDATKAALEPVCSNMQAISQPAQKGGASGETIAQTADIVIIGTGGAGMAAASEAIKTGKSVIMIDKMPSVGGNTIRAGSALNSADPDRQKAFSMSADELNTIKGILQAEPKSELMKGWIDTLKGELQAYEDAGSDFLFDSPSLHKLQTYMGGDYVANDKLIDVFADSTLDAINYLAGLGVEWEEDVTIAMGATWRRSHNPKPVWGSLGSSFVLPVEEYNRENGVEILLGYKAEELLMQNGSCTGVKGVTEGGQTFELTAGNVILATGGFSSNVEMRQAYNKHWANLGDNIGSTNHPGATGDGIVMAEAAGANLVGMEWIQLVPWGGPGIPTAAIDTLIFVNKEGKRFINEDNRRDIMSNAVLQQTDQSMFMIYDGHTVIDGIAIAGGTEMDSQVGQGYVFKADTLEDLAAQLNLPVDAFKATIDSFNKAVENGNDEFERKVFSSKIDKAPFYATATMPYVHHTMGGVEINMNAEVLDTDGAVIPGLFAAGEVTGGIHGSNRLGGNAIADIIVFGRIAGQNASK